MGIAIHVISDELGVGDRKKNAFDFDDEEKPAEDEATKIVEEETAAAPAAEADFDEWAPAATGKKAKYVGMVERDAPAG